MITIIVGTNRPNSNSKKVALQYQEILNDHDVSSTILDLATLPKDFMNTAMYDKMGTNPEFNPTMAQMKETRKFVFIVPEYNGSFPGALKVFLDSLEYPDTFRGKTCALVGISSGIQGGALAMSHLTDIFNYLGMHVLANKPKLPGINQKMNDGKVTAEIPLKIIREQAEDLIRF